MNVENKINDNDSDYMSKNEIDGYLLENKLNNGDKLVNDVNYIRVLYEDLIFEDEFKFK